MTRKQTFKIGLVLLFIPIVIGLFVYSEMPDMMPTHFDFNNEPDSYSSKEFALFGLPLLMIGIYLFTYFIVNADPRRKYQNDKILNVTFLTIPVISILVTLLTISSSRGNTPDIGLWINVLISIIFIFLGNYLPKTKRNYTVGIKIPWTLHSDKVWEKTHRFGGKVFVIGGFIALIMSFISSKIVFGIYLLVAFIPMIYSYKVYKELDYEK